MRARSRFTRRIVCLAWLTASAVTARIKTTILRDPRLPPARGCFQSDVQPATECDDLDAHRFLTPHPRRQHRWIDPAFKFGFDRPVINIVASRHSI
jgi:hypothetical protein